MIYIIQETLDHTALRFFERPDFLPLLQEARDYEIIWKAGSDGQTGLGSCARWSEHNPDISFNESAMVLTVRFFQFHIICT